MTGKSYEENRQEFLKLFGAVAPYKHRYDVFRDFVTMASISIRNACIRDDELEEEYLKLIRSYKETDRRQFPKLLALVVELLDEEPTDVLGGLFMELELGSKHNGQFFTPNAISDLMANIIHNDELVEINKPFLTVSEPCCGAGGMVLAFVKAMINHGHNPAQRLWVQCIDVDRIAALMCYIQLSLWHVPAEVIVGNVLSLEIREVWHTPAHILGNWGYKIRSQENRQSDLSNPVSKIAPIASTEEPQVTSKKPIQFDFGF